MKSSRKWHYVTESEGDTDVIKVEQSPPSKVKKSAAKKKKTTSSHASSANVSSKKRQLSETEYESESNVESEECLSGLEYSPSQTLDSYYDEENVILESPKHKRRSKKVKCKVIVKKQKTHEVSDDSSDEELSSPVKPKCMKKKRGHHLPLQHPLHL